MGFGDFLKDFYQQAAIRKPRIKRDIPPASERPQPLEARDICPRRPPVLLEGVTGRDTPPRALEIDRMLAEGELQGPRDLSGHRNEQLFRKTHQILVGRIGLIELQHCKLRIVPHRDPFVAEVAIQLEDPLDPADQKALEKQLRRYSEVEVHIQRVVVGDERPGGGASGNRLHHRRLDFQEIPLLKKTADQPDDLGSFFKEVSDFAIDHEIHVALPVTNLDIRQPVPFLRQRSQALAQKPQTLSFQSQFFGFGAEKVAPHPYDIPEVQGLKKPVSVFPYPIPTHVDLEPALAVLEMKERGLAEGPDRHDPRGKKRS